MSMQAKKERPAQWLARKIAKTLLKTNMIDQSEKRRSKYAGCPAAQSMRQIFRTIPPLIVLALIVVSFYGVATSKQLEKCIHDGVNHADNQSQYGNYEQSARVVVACAGTFVADNQGSVTAFSGLLVALFTGTLWWATKRLQDASIQQSADMQLSIAESARAASAMENVATHFAANVGSFRERSSQQMRAYIGVIVGGATYQERNKDLRFAGRPRMVNAGETPAHKVEFRAVAKLLPIPLPEEFDFRLPDIVRGGAVLNPHQDFQITEVVDCFCDDSEVLDIMRGRGQRALYCYGVITYEDVFGEPHYTKFSQVLTWIPLPDQFGRVIETPYGYFTTRHNESD